MCRGVVNLYNSGGSGGGAEGDVGGSVADGDAEAMTGGGVGQWAEGVVEVSWRIGVG